MWCHSTSTFESSCIDLKAAVVFGSSPSSCMNKTGSSAWGHSETGLVGSDLGLCVMDRMERNVSTCLLSIFSSLVSTLLSVWCFFNLGLTAVTSMSSDMDVDDDDDRWGRIFSDSMLCVSCDLLMHGSRLVWLVWSDLSIVCAGRERSLSSIAWGDKDLRGGDTRGGGGDEEDSDVIDALSAWGTKTWWLMGRGEKVGGAGLLQGEGIRVPKVRHNHSLVIACRWRNDAESRISG